MNKRIPIIIGFLFLALAIWVQLTSYQPVVTLLNRLQNLAYDMQLRANLFAHKRTFTTSVVIVDIDDKSLQKIGRWPWPRSQLAELITHLKAQGAVVIAFDMLFPEKEDNIVDLVLGELKKENPSLDTTTKLEKIKPLFAFDNLFSEGLKKLDVVLGMTFKAEEYAVGKLPPPLLTLNNDQKQLGILTASGYIADIPLISDAGKTAGFINIFPDSDGIIRRVPLLIRYQDNLYPSLALEAVRIFLLGKVNLLTATYGDSLRLEGVEIGNHVIPTDNKSQVLIPFPGKSYTMPFYSAVDVIENKLPADTLEGKIVFVGTSATGLGDIHATAVAAIYPGVEVHAAVAHGILQDQFSYKPPWALGAEICLTAILGLIFIFVFPYLGPRTLGVLIFIIPAALIFLNDMLWNKTGLIISILVPMVLPIVLAMVNILYGFLFETLKRERLKEMFGQYVPETHIDEMLKTTGKNYALHGEDREMTVLFADIRNFTTISEPMSATELKDLLNAFFTPMTEIIFKYRGTIDKYVGDLIMAFWGAPLKDKKHAQHAISAAIDMQIAVDKLADEFAKRNWPHVEIGIGLNTGVMSVGDMGSKFRRNYTVLGDAVNLASRVESLTKFYGVKIMVTETTQRDQKLFVFRQLDRVKVKGKKMGIAIFEVVCRRVDATNEISKEIEVSNLALDYYFNQQWAKARELFGELHEQHPDVKLYSLYLSRLAEYELNPPGADWDGIYVHLSK